MSVRTRSSEPPMTTGGRKDTTREPLLTPEEAARRLAISQRQLLGLVQAGAISFINVGIGKRPARRYEPSEIERFIDDRRTTFPRGVELQSLLASARQCDPNEPTSLDEVRARLEVRKRAAASDRLALRNRATSETTQRAMAHLARLAAGGKKPKGRT